MRKRGQVWHAVEFIVGVVLLYIILGTILSASAITHVARSHSVGAEMDEGEWTYTLNTLLKKEITIKDQRMTFAEAITIKDQFHPDQQLMVEQLWKSSVTEVLDKCFPKAIHLKAKGGADSTRRYWSLTSSEDLSVKQEPEKTNRENTPIIIERCKSKKVADIALPSTTFTLFVCTEESTC